MYLKQHSKSRALFSMRYRRNYYGYFTGSSGSYERLSAAVKVCSASGVTLKRNLLQLFLTFFLLKIVYINMVTKPPSPCGN